MSFNLLRPTIIMIVASQSNAMWFLFHMATPISFVKLSLLFRQKKFRIIFLCGLRTVRDSRHLCGKYYIRLSVLTFASRHCRMELQMNSLVWLIKKWVILYSNSTLKYQINLHISFGKWIKLGRPSKAIKYTENFTCIINWAAIWNWTLIQE